MWFTRLGRFTVRRRRLVLSLTLLFVILAGALGSGAFGVLQQGGFEDPAAESTVAHGLLESQFGTGDPNLVLLVAAHDGDVDAPEVAREGAQLVDVLMGADGVGDVVSYWAVGAPALRSVDGSTALVLAHIDGDDGEVEDRFTALADQVRGDHGSVTVTLGGSAAANHEMGEQIGTDLALAEGISVPITLVLLVLVFGGLVAAGLPLLVALVSVAGTFLSLFVIGSITDVSIYSINLTTALGLGLAIDYSLFIVSRFREELARGLDVERAVVRTVETAGRTVAFSAFVVAASLVALLVFPLYFLRSFAYAGVSVVLVAAAGAVVSLPALLAVVGGRVNRFSLRRRRRSAPVPSGGGFWHRLAHGVMRRPLPVALGTIGLLVFLGTPFLRVSFGLPSTASLPSGAESREVAETMVETYATNNGQRFSIVVPEANPADVATIDAYAAQVSAVEHVGAVETLTGTYVAGELTTGPDDGSERFAPGPQGVYLTVTPTVEQRSAAGEVLVEALRDLDAPFAAGVQPLVEGGAAQLLDTKAAIADRLPIALAIVAGVTFVLLFLVFGSVLVPLKAIVLNLLSLSATFGAMVWVFQDGHLSDLLGFTADGTLDVSMPILMFCIAFGLSMDYEVFLLSRIKEEYDRTGDNTHSVAMGLERTGRIVTAAAALLAVTFAAFGVSGVSFIQMFGIGLALAVVMDATIIRGLLVPAFMRLAGRANWWAPGWMRRLHDRFGIREGDQAGDVDRAAASPVAA